MLYRGSLSYPLIRCSRLDTSYQLWKRRNCLRTECNHITQQSSIPRRNVEDFRLLIGLSTQCSYSEVLKLRTFHFLSLHRSRLHLLGNSEWLRNIRPHIHESQSKWLKLFLHIIRRSGLGIAILLCEVTLQIFLCMSQWDQENAVASIQCNFSKAERIRHISYFENIRRSSASTTQCHNYFVKNQVSFALCILCNALYCFLDQRLCQNWFLAPCIQLSGHVLYYKMACLLGPFSYACSNLISTRFVNRELTD